MKLFFIAIRYIARILIFILFFLMSPNVYSQTIEDPIKLNLHTVEDSAEDPSDFVMQHGKVDLKLGKLTISSNFLYKGEVAPNQGYLIRFKDYMKIETSFNNLTGSCDTVIDEFASSCKKDLVDCNNSCNDRVSLLEQKNRDLTLRLDETKLSLKEASNSKVLWAIISLSAGIGLGAIIFSVAN